MWQFYSPALRVRLAVVLLFAAVATPFTNVRPLHADAACGDVVINEVLFNEDTPLDDEWVELYVVNALPVGTVLIVQDNDSGTSDFNATFTLAEEIAANRYIIVHGETAAGSQEPNIGTLNIYEAGDGYIDLTNTNENIGLFVDGTICEEVYWGSSADSNTAAFGAPSTMIFTGSSAIGDGESIARNPNGSGEFVSGETSGLYNAVNGQSIGRNNVDGTLAVTLSWVESQRIGDSIMLTWQTATETGTAGFNLLAEEGDGTVQLNPTLIPSPVIDAVTPTDYRFSAVTDASVFFIQEVGIDGSISEMGPYFIGAIYGVPASPARHPLNEQLYLPLIR